MKKNCLVYKATGPTGKVYIGRTSLGLQKRKTDHIRDSLKKSEDSISHFHLALKAHGKDSFTWEVLADNLSFDDSVKLEAYYIQIFDSINRDKGYNLRGGDANGTTHLPETIEKIRERAREQGRRMYSGPDAEKHLKVRSEVGKAIWANSDNRDKMTKNIGIARRSEESRKKTSEDCIKRYSDPKKKEEMSIACGGRRFEAFKDGVSLGIFQSQKMFAELYGLKSRGHISNVLHGRCPSYCGYTFKFI